MPDLPEQLLVDLRLLLDYNEKDEQRDFQEMFPQFENEPDLHARSVYSHIYGSICRLRLWVDRVR